MRRLKEAFRGFVDLSMFFNIIWIDLCKISCCLSECTIFNIALEVSLISYPQDMSDEEMVEAESSPVALRPTPSPSPPPDPLAGLPPYYPALQGCR